MRVRRILLPGHASKNANRKRHSNGRCERRPTNLRKQTKLEAIVVRICASDPRRLFLSVLQWLEVLSACANFWGVTRIGCWNAACGVRFLRHGRAKECAGFASRRHLSPTIRGLVAPFASPSHRLHPQLRRCDGEVNRGGPRLLSPSGAGRSIPSPPNAVKIQLSQRPTPAASATIWLRPSAAQAALGSIRGS